MSYNLEVYQGTDYLRTFTVLDNNNTILNLTNCTIIAQLRRNTTSSEYISFVTSIVNALNGIASISLSNTVTSGLSGNYMYDIFVITNDNKKYKISDGLVTIKPRVTR